MKWLRYSVISLVALVFSVSDAAAQVSVLTNINCGGNQASCLQQTVGTFGAVRCTCTADCLGPGCQTSEVAATRQASWGPSCTFSLTGTATGGTQTVSIPTVYSAVFAQVQVSGPFIGSPELSRQVSDCFKLTFRTDPPIKGIC